MPEEQESQNGAPTQTDIFQQQKKTIDTLVDVLNRQGDTPSQIIYASPAPTSQQPAKTPNYLLYLAAGIIVLILLRGK